MECQNECLNRFLNSRMDARKSVRMAERVSEFLKTARMPEYTRKNVRIFGSQELCQCAMCGHAKESKLHPAVSQDTGSPGNGWVLAASTSARYGLARWIYEERWGKYMWDEIASNHGKNLGCRKYTNHDEEFSVWRIDFLAQEARALDWKGCMPYAFPVLGGNPTESEANLFSPTASSNDMRLH